MRVSMRNSYLNVSEQQIRVHIVFPQAQVTTFCVYPRHSAGPQRKTMHCVFDCNCSVPSSFLVLCHWNLIRMMMMMTTTTMRLNKHRTDQMTSKAVVTTTIPLPFLGRSCRERENVYLPLANTSIAYSTMCLYAVVGRQKGQSPSKLATHCSKQHNNTQ